MWGAWSTGFAEANLHAFHSIKSEIAVAVLAVLALATYGLSLAAGVELVTVPLARLVKGKLVYPT